MLDQHISGTVAFLPSGQTRSACTGWVRSTNVIAADAPFFPTIPRSPSPAESPVVHFFRSSMEPCPRSRRPFPDLLPGPSLSLFCCATGTALLASSPSEVRESSGEIASCRVVRPWASGE